MKSYINDAEQKQEKKLALWWRYARAYEALLQDWRPWITLYKDPCGSNTGTIRATLRWSKIGLYLRETLEQQLIFKCEQGNN